MLFGEEMVNKGHQIDWLLQSEDPCSRGYTVEWNGCTVYVGATDLRSSLLARLHKHLLGIKHDLQTLRLAATNKYDFIQVKDKFLAGLIAIVAAYRSDCRFVYWLSYPFPESSLYEARAGIARYPRLSWIRGHVFKFLLYRVIARFADHVIVQSD